MIKRPITLRQLLRDLWAHANNNPAALDRPVAALDMTRGRDDGGDHVVEGCSMGSRAGEPIHAIVYFGPERA